MNVSVVLRLTVFAVMVALGIASGIHTNLSQADPLKSTCTSKKCNLFGEPVDPACEKDGQQKKCLFGDAGGDLIWCDGTTGSCELVTPTESNACTGTCQDTGVSCFTTFYSKCKNPKGGGGL